MSRGGFEFQERTAVVTGGGSGIGSGIVMALARSGANVAVADVEINPATAVAKRAASCGVDSFAVRVDVSSREEVHQLHAIVSNRLGPAHLLCNNAGVSALRRGVDACYEDWQWVLGVNLWGIIHGMDAFLPGMIASGQRCHVVNTASMNGLFPSARSAMYSASKYAVVGLSETYRNELAETLVGISVLCPAAVRTRIDESERNRPPHLAPTSPAPDFVPSASYRLSPPLEPSEVGALVVQGIIDDRLYLFTDPKVRPYLETRHHEVMTDLEAIEGRCATTPQWESREARP